MKRHQILEFLDTEACKWKSKSSRIEKTNHTSEDTELKDSSSSNWSVFIFSCSLPSWHVFDIDKNHLCYRAKTWISAVFSYYVIFRSSFIKIIFIPALNGVAQPRYSYQFICVNQPSANNIPLQEIQYRVRKYWCHLIICDQTMPSHNLVASHFNDGHWNSFGASEGEWWRWTSLQRQLLSSWAFSRAGTLLYLQAMAAAIIK